MQPAMSKTVIKGFLGEETWFTEERDCGEDFPCKVVLTNTVLCHLHTEDDCDHV